MAPLDQLLEITETRLKPREHPCNKLCWGNEHCILPEKKKGGVDGDQKNVRVEVREVDRRQKKRHEQEASHGYCPAAGNDRTVLCVARQGILG